MTCPRNDDVIVSWTVFYKGPIILKKDFFKIKYFKRGIFLNFAEGIYYQANMSSQINFLYTKLCLPESKAYDNY